MLAVQYRRRSGSRARDSAVISGERFAAAAVVLCLGDDVAEATSSRFTVIAPVVRPLFSIRVVSFHPSLGALQFLESESAI